MTPSIQISNRGIVGRSIGASRRILPHSVVIDENACVGSAMEEESRS